MMVAMSGEIVGRQEDGMGSRTEGKVMMGRSSGGETGENFSTGLNHLNTTWPRWFILLEAFCSQSGSAVWF